MPKDDLEPMTPQAIEAQVEAIMGDDTGLEDFDHELGIPRVQIVHDEAQFEDKSTGLRYDTLYGVPLGLVLQRVMWDVQMKEDSLPLCQSRDGKVGTPGDSFPWKDSAMNIKDLGTNLGAQGEVEDSVLCENCWYKEWGSHPTRDTPFCQEQWVIPFQMEDDETSTPVILTFKGSGVTAAKRFIAPVSKRRGKLFESYVDISLEARKNGSVKYAVPVFKKARPTDPQFYPDFANNYITIRDFLHKPPRSETPVEVKVKSHGDDELDEF